VQADALFEIDRYAIAEAQAVVTAVQADYAEYQFHLGVQRLVNYCSEELGGFYLDVLKDRLYTTPAKSLARRSAQTALAHVRDLLLKSFAPVLSFTAEEAWRIVAPADPTIFVHTFDDRWVDVADAEALRAKWRRILDWRARVQKDIEALRQAGTVGASLQAEIALVADGDDYAALASLGDDLRFVFITSAAAVTRGTPSAIRATPTAHPKCERCWHWRADVGADAAHPSLCGRCVANLFGAGEARRFA
jgi:isoleucyl-tRNA synthetase